MNTSTSQSLMLFMAGSHTTNCLAPLAKVIHDKFGIFKGLITLFHTSTKEKYYWRGGGNRSRGVPLGDVIDSEENIAEAVETLLPTLHGKFTKVDFPCLIANHSVVDLTVRMEKRSCYMQIKAVIGDESKGKLKGILGYIEKNVVNARDFIGDSRSCIIYAVSSCAIDTTEMKFLAFIDNDWGYSSRVLDLIAHMAKTR